MLLLVVAEPRETDQLARLDQEVAGAWACLAGIMQREGAGPAALTARNRSTRRPEARSGLGRV